MKTSVDDLLEILARRAEERAAKFQIPGNSDARAELLEFAREIRDASPSVTE